MVTLEHLICQSVHLTTSGRGFASVSSKHDYLTLSQRLQRHKIEHYETNMVSEEPHNGATCKSTTSVRIWTLSNARTEKKHHVSWHLSHMCCLVRTGDVIRTMDVPSS
ncbi:hypothetical protein ACHWQZ_G016404 [Mnemiopsis leidyi]